MKFFTNRNLIQKVIIAIVCVTLLNFCITPSIVRADDGTGWGGKILSPMRSLLTAIADTAISVVQFGITGEWLPAVEKKVSGVPTGVSKDENSDSQDENSNSQSDYWNTEDFQYPIIQISPELIFANEVRLLDVNFIRDTFKDSYEIENSKGAQAMLELRRTIANWYVTLRTTSMIGLLSVLVYVGIRIIISSTAQDKSKYKQRLMDWLVAFCILFFMHYIMAGVLGIVDRVNDTLSDACSLESGLTLNPKYGGIQYTHQNSLGGYIGGEVGMWYDLFSGNLGQDRDQDTIDQVREMIASKGYTEVSSSDDFILKNTKPDGFMTTISTYEYTITCEEAVYTIQKIEHETKYLDSTGLAPTSSKNYEYKYSEVFTNQNGEETEGGSTTIDGKNIKVSSDPNKVLYFINYARMYLNAKNDDKYVPMAFGYLFIYIVLIIFTGMFAIRYMKRVVYIAFLTMISPLVALTYPIDKIKDRKSTSIQYVV